MTLREIGISGCKLVLIDNTTLRKISPSKEYNARLKIQSEKQKNFTIDSDNILAPQIFSEGHDSGLFWFDMEYIDGKLFNETFQRISKSELDVYVNNIIFYLRHVQQTSTGTYSDTEIRKVLRYKLESLHSKSKYNTFIDFLMQMVERINLPHIEQGICHGDLTFSNILFSNQKLYFLDFLDSYIESYVMDIVKLKQDLCHNWYLNLLPTDDSYVTRIQQIFKYIWSRIEKEYPIVHTDLFYILDVINFLRIEPYLTTESQHTNLDRVIGESNLYEKFNSSNDGKVNAVSKS